MQEYGFHIQLKYEEISRRCMIHNVLSRTTKLLFLRLQSDSDIILDSPYYALIASWEHHQVPDERFFVIITVLLFGRCLQTRPL